MGRGEEALESLIKQLAILKNFKQLRGEKRFATGKQDLGLTFA